jgi:hypothetical protein
MALAEKPCMEYLTFRYGPRIERATKNINICEFPDIKKLTTKNTAKLLTCVRLKTLHETAH